MGLYHRGFGDKIADFKTAAQKSIDEGARVFEEIVRWRAEDGSLAAAFEIVATDILHEMDLQKKFSFEESTPADKQTAEEKAIRLAAKNMSLVQRPIG